MARRCSADAIGGARCGGVAGGDEAQRGERQRRPHVARELEMPVMDRVERSPEDAECAVRGIVHSRMPIGVRVCVAGGRGPEVMVPAAASLRSIVPAPCGARFIRTATRAPSGMRSRPASMRARGCRSGAETGRSGGRCPHVGPPRQQRIVAGVPRERAEQFDRPILIAADRCARTADRGTAARIGRARDPARRPRPRRRPSARARRLERARRVAKDVAGELVEQDHARQRAVAVADQSANAPESAASTASPKRARIAASKAGSLVNQIGAAAMRRFAEPEFQYLGRCRVHRAELPVDGVDRLAERVARMRPERLAERVRIPHFMQRAHEHDGAVVVDDERADLGADILLRRATTRRRGRAPCRSCRSAAGD